MENRIFKVVLTKDPDGYYIADIPTLKHCITYGDTIEEAMENIKEALTGVLATMEAKKIPIPDDSSRLEYQLTVPIKSSRKKRLVQA